MATKLDKPVTRELALRHKTRAVLVTLVPEDAITRQGEAIEFRLKGTRQKVRRPVEEVFRSAIRAAIVGARK